MLVIFNFNWLTLSGQHFSIQVPVCAVLIRREDDNHLLLTLNYYIIRCCVHILQFLEVNRLINKTALELLSK